MTKHFLHPYGRTPNVAYVPSYADMDNLNFLGRYLIEVTDEEKKRSRVRRDIASLAYSEAWEILEKEGLDPSNHCFVGQEKKNGDVEWRLVVGWVGPIWYISRYRRGQSDYKRKSVNLSGIVRPSIRRSRKKDTGRKWL